MPEVLRICVSNKTCFRFFFYMFLARQPICLSLCRMLFWKLWTACKVERITLLYCSTMLIVHIIHWPLQSFSQNCGLASHTTYVVCFNFIREWRTYSLTSTLNVFIFCEKFFHGRFVYSQSFCQTSAERKSPKKYFFSRFILMPDLGYEPGLYV